MNLCQCIFNKNPPPQKKKKKEKKKSNWILPLDIEYSGIDKCNFDLKDVS